MQLDFEAEILKLENQLPFLEQEISQLEQLVIEDSNNLNLLKGSSLSLERAASSPTLEQIISSYKTKINQLKRDRNNSLSEINILSKKLDALKKNTLQSPDLFKLEARRRALENFTSHPEKLFRLEQEQKTLENEFQTLTSQTPVKTRPIGNIQTDTIKPKPQLVISLSIILGFITSILLVFIRNFVKSYKESQA
jgi:LPS O-antigen subunit length determinant protein (WzzB/FepE family)